MAKRVGVFFAYPSEPSALGETITNAIAEMRTTPELRTVNVRFRPWPDLSVSGQSLVAQITSAIDDNAVFACDVTYPNPNVAFELGYAIGRFKPLWLTLDTTIAEAANDYVRYYTGMLGAGYAPYQNHHDLAAAFVRDRPWTSNKQALLPDRYRRPAPRPEQPTLFYVKPPFETGAVVAVSELIGRSGFAEALILDDPRENPAPTLEWYADKLHAADAALIHLLAQDQKDRLRHNAKASFVAGLAHGFSKSLLMLAHVPFVCPTDYQTLLKSHHTAIDAENAVTSWMTALPPVQRRSRRALASARKEILSLELRSLAMGEPVAENETLSLDDYFVETSFFYEAQETQSTVLVGRRGTGKTALYIALQSAFARDKRNHVCAIKPVGYEIEGLVRLLSEDLNGAERGFLIESLWKFLIYTELASSVCREINGRPPHIVKSTDEEALCQYVNQHADVLLAPFSQRVGRAVHSLQGLSSIGTVESQRQRISEHLHREHLGSLRRLLGLVLSGRNKVAILIDNLDEQWGVARDTAVLSSLLLGLLREINNLAIDFHHGDAYQKAFNVSVTTFIRSDIFAYLHPLTNERDKWPLRRMTWNDRALLLRVVDERLRHGAPPSVTASEIWAKIFPSEVVGVSPQDFILRSTMPRPRDVIFLVKEAMAQAVNRGRETVAEEDFLEARNRYSRFVFGSVLAEDDPERGRLEEVLFEFAGAGRQLSKSDVHSRISQAGVVPGDVEFYVNLFCDINFLGIQTSTGFTFAADENDRQMLIEVSRRLAAAHDREERFEVNPAFHQALQID